MRLGAPVYGVAIGEGGLWYGPVGDPIADVRWLELEAMEDSDRWPALEKAFSEIRSGAARGTRRLRITLLPPLVRHRMVDRRSLQNRELEILVQRNPERYFIGSGSGALHVHVRSGCEEESAFVMAVEQTLLHAVEHAARIWKRATIMAAADIWLATARDQRFQRVAIELESMALLFEGTFKGLHVCRACSLKQLAMGRDTDCEDPAEPSARQTLIFVAGTEPEPGAVAAVTPTVSGAPSLVSRARLARLATQSLRGSAVIATAALLLSAAADGVKMARYSGEIQRLGVERALVANAAHEASMMLDTIHALGSSMAARSSDASASELLIRAAEELPGDAFLTAISMTRDSVTLEVMTGSAPETVAALRALLPAVTLEEGNDAPGSTRSSIVATAPFPRF